jgi:hypothetical protein
VQEIQSNKMIERTYSITLKDTVTGDTRTFEEKSSGDDASDADRNIEYLWEGGNYACDCNRSLFLWNFDKTKELKCDLGVARIELVELEPIQ